MRIAWYKPKPVSFRFPISSFLSFFLFIFFLFPPRTAFKRRAFPPFFLPSFPPLHFYLTFCPLLSPFSSRTLPPLLPARSLFPSFAGPFNKRARARAPVVEPGRACTVQPGNPIRSYVCYAKCSLRSQCVPAGAIAEIWRTKEKSNDDVARASRE